MMADMISLFRNVFQYTYNAVSAVASFNHKVVSSLIHGTASCYRVTTVVVKGLSSATGEILFYIGDFVIEALYVVSICLRLVGKFLTLIYHILSSLAGGTLLALEFVGSLIAQGITQLYFTLKSLSKQLNELWVARRSDILITSAEAGNSIYALCSNVFEVLSSYILALVIASLKGLNYVGEIINAATLEVVEAGTTIFQQAFRSVHSSCQFIWTQACTACSNYINELMHFLEACLNPFCLSLKQVKVSGYAFWRSFTEGLTSIPTTVYIYIVVMTLSVVLLKSVLEHMSRRGLSFHLNLSSTHHLRPLIRRERALMIDISDEEDIREYVEQQRDSESDQAPYDDDDVDEMDTDTSDSEEDNSSQTNDVNDDDLDDEVEEFELASDSESETGSEAPILIELPERDNRYNLRRRFSPSPLLNSSNPGRMTPGQLEKRLESERDKRLCVVCVDDLKNVLVLPCRHMCLCINCAHEIANQRMRARRVCPLCRARIETVMNVFT